jgi:hypothetical protein
MGDKSDLVDLAMQIHAETDSAVCVSLEGDRRKAVWLPKSQVEIERKPKAIVVVTMPEWLAVNKGLV